jgi:hypothetical protein
VLVFPYEPGYGHGFIYSLAHTVNRFHAMGRSVSLILCYSLLRSVIDNDLELHEVHLKAHRIT